MALIASAISQPARNYVLYGEQKCEPVDVFHLRLRQFPHNHCQFNVSDDELAPIVDAWARGEWIALGERRWSPHQANLTIVEGPRIALAALSMGRGWRQAEREGQVVTGQVLKKAAPAGHGAARQGDPPPRAAVRRAGSDALDAVAQHPSPADVNVHGLLGGNAEGAALLQAWRDVTARSPELSPSERLALAELQLRTTRA